MLLHDVARPGASCQSREIVRDGVVQAMVTGYPSPTVTWFRDVQRTNRIINDSVYQLLPSGDVSINNYMIFPVCYIIFMSSFMMLLFYPS